MAKPLIDKIDVKHRETSSNGGSFERIVTALNPLKFISENIAQIAHYTVEIKRINAEIHRVDAEKDIRLKQVKATKDVLIAAIIERHESLKAQLCVVETELKNQHLSKMQLIQCISNLTNLLGDNSISSEDKINVNEAIALLTTSLGELGRQSAENLQLITSTTMKSLEAIPEYKLLRLDS